MDINTIYQYLLKLIRKNQSGGLNATDFGLFWNGQQSSYFADLLGRFNAHSNGKSGPNTGLIENETILGALSPFTKTINLPILAGIGQRPADFKYRLAMRINGSAIRIVKSDELWSLTDDVIDPPSVADNCYYASIVGSTYVFNPVVANFDLDYISIPPDVKWNYTIDPNTKLQTYNPSGSVQSLWDDVCNREITERVLKSLGVSLQAGDMSSFGQSIVTAGS